MDKVLIAILGGGNLLLFIEFLINRYDRKKEKQEGSLKDELKVLKKDVIRMQLLVLVVMMPKEKQEILKVAEHYFKDLNGNWYMTTIFNNWLESNKIARPEWFDRRRKDKEGD